MKLLNEIIAALSTERSSLTEALLKTKVLLHDIGHQELVERVNHELNGYPEDVDVPKYRLPHAEVLANLINMAYQVNAHPIPIGHLEKKHREFLQTARMHQSLAVLEKPVGPEGGHLALPIAMEFNALLGRQLASGFKIQRAWSAIQPADIAQIFVQVRSRLLDFVLSLKDQLSEDVPENEMRQRAGSVDTAGLFNNAIFGNNTTIVVGNNSRQEVANVNVRGDFNALAENLRTHGVDESSIAALEEAIEQDEGVPEISEKRFGPWVKAWLQDMLSKAVYTTWQIDLGIASSLLATALQKYYGWP